MSRILFIISIVGFFSCHAFPPDETPHLEKEVPPHAYQSKNPSTEALAQKGPDAQTVLRPLTDTTPFHIRSLATHMTAYMMLATLQEKYPRKSLSNLLDKKLTTVFPGPFLRSIGRVWTYKTTLYDLLTHKSGFSDCADGLTEPENFTRPLTCIEFLRAMRVYPDKPLLPAHSNYVLIGKLIEEMNGDTLDHIFEKWIKNPANLADSFCDASENDVDLRRVGMRFHSVPGLSDKITFVDLSQATGAGSVTSTPDDLTQWGKYFFQSAPEVIRNLMLQNYKSNLDENRGILMLSITDSLTDTIVHQSELNDFGCFFGYAPVQKLLFIFIVDDKEESQNFMTTTEFSAALDTALQAPEIQKRPSTLLESAHAGPVPKKSKKKNKKTGAFLPSLTQKIVVSEKT